MSTDVKKDNIMNVDTVAMDDAHSALVIIDQTRLPGEVHILSLTEQKDIWEAIYLLKVRGAPAIGVAAAIGIYLAAKGINAKHYDDFYAQFKQAKDYLATARPTAVNLFWAIGRMKKLYASLAGEPAGEVRLRLVEEAQRIRREDIAINEAMGRHGAALVPDGKTVLTHCNAGALATAGYGTALGVIRAAVAAGKKIDVFADETRPFLQGARLTAWELLQDGIPTTVITDNMAGHFLKSGRIGCVIVGADRIAANGDVANKIGTYSVAVLAKENEVPFYVAAPVSTLDLSLASGGQIPIEQRPASEVTHVFGVPVAAAGARVENPAFDVTPNRYVTAIITERGVARAPYEESLRRIVLG